MDNPVINPMPYLGAAYGIATVLLLGYAVWSGRLRHKLEATVAVIQEEECSGCGTLG